MIEMAGAKTCAAVTLVGKGVISTPAVSNQALERHAADEEGHGRGGDARWRSRR